MGDEWWHMIGFRQERSRGGRRFPLFADTKACYLCENPAPVCVFVWKLALRQQLRAFMILHDSEHCSQCAYGKCICIESVGVPYVLLHVFSSMQKHTLVVWYRVC